MLRRVSSVMLFRGGVGGIWLLFCFGLERKSPKHYGTNSAFVYVCASNSKESFHVVIVVGDDSFKNDVSAVKATLEEMQHIKGTYGG